MVPRAVVACHLGVGNNVWIGGLGAQITSLFIGGIAEGHWYNVETVLAFLLPIEGMFLLGHGLFNITVVPKRSTTPWLITQ